MTRTAEVTRETRETTIWAELDLDGRGGYQIETGNAMLDHLLAQLARHGGFGLRVTATVHQDPDGHHLAEDVALVVGRAFDQALGDRLGIRRMYDAAVPMDDALATVAVDLSGRGYAAVHLSFTTSAIGDLRSELVRHVLETLAREARMTLHVRVVAGHNDHHMAEAVFKALARALQGAVALDPRMEGQAPSTKGTLG